MLFVCASHIESEEVGVDIGYFRGLHAGVTEKFTRLCQEWEEKSNKLEQEYTSDDNTNTEDINIEDGKFYRLLLVCVCVCVCVCMCVLIVYLYPCSSWSDSNNSLPSSTIDAKEAEAVHWSCR